MDDQTAPTRQKLLIIDDDIAITRTAQQVAGELNFSARAVTIPSRAVDEFIEFRPDVVLLDMVMPERDGLEILDEFLLTGIPTKLVLTCEFGRAYILLAEGIARFHRAEIAAVLRKPFRRDVLKTTLINVVARQVSVAAET
jgi:CheY-like chemotaxis protein